MKKFNYLSEPTNRTFLLPNGKMIAFVSYDSKVDLNNECYFSIADKEYKKCGLPTFNQLCAEGIVKEISCVREYEVRPGKSSLSADDFLAIQKEFADNGFEVSIEALKHNYEAWLQDYKSAYRDAKCHIWTPCGCNPLYFLASTLHESCKDWQTTYIA